MTSTTPAFTVHDCWSRADKINTQICDMRDFAHVITMAAASLDTEEGEAINTLSFKLVQMCQSAHESMEKLQNKLKSIDGKDEEAEEAAS